MNDLGWGLTMTAAGMGAVYALLALLMAVLYGIGRLDRAAPPAPPGHRDDDLLPEPGTGPTVAISGADGIDADALAAIAIAVITHAEVRRQQAAPAMRVHQPGSQLHASRWVGAGRAHQNRPWTRS